VTGELPVPRTRRESLGSSQPGRHKIVDFAVCIPWLLKLDDFDTVLQRPGAGDNVLEPTPGVAARVKRTVILIQVGPYESAALTS
jgi:hypothetical protein